MESIGIFDSGLGGLSVLARAQKLLKNENFLYFADTDHVPYGEKTKEQVVTYVLDAMGFMNKQGVKAVVVACNTATSVAIEEARRAFTFPIIGIEPAVKPALSDARPEAKRVLVCATRLTLKEERFHRLVASLDDVGCVDGLALPGLVELAEKFDFSEGSVKSYLAEQFLPFDLKAYGAVVLGCTHFPLFSDYFRSFFPPDVALVDGGEGTVAQLDRVLGHNGLLSDSVVQGKPVFCCSGRWIEDPKLLQKYNGVIERMNTLWQ